MANVSRTPTKRREESNVVTKEWMKELLSTEFQKVESRFSQLEENINATLNEKLGAIEERLAEVERENGALKDLNAELQQRILLVEREARQLNIVASGIHFDTQKEGFTKLQNLLNESVRKDLSISGVRTFTTKKGKSIVAKCENFDDKLEIMRAKKSLGANIFIDSDLTQADRIGQAHLRDLARKARLEGKDARVGFGKIKIDGQWMKLNNKTNELSPVTFRQTDPHPHMEHTGSPSKTPGNQ